LEDGLDDGAIESPRKPTKKAKGVTSVKSTARKAMAKPSILEDGDEDQDVEAKASKKDTGEQASENELSELDASPKGVAKRRKSPTKPTTLKKAKRTHEVAVKERNAENGEAKASAEEAPVDADPGNESEMSLVLDPTPLKKSRSQNPDAGSSKKQGKTKVSKSRSKERSKKGSVGNVRRKLVVALLTSTSPRQLVISALTRKR